MPNTNALERVRSLKNKTGGVLFNGIRLSSSQLRVIADALDAESQGPDGLCFMVGKEGSIRTVEIIPYFIDQSLNKRFYQKNGMVGAINIDAGKEFPQTNFKLMITNDGIESVPDNVGGGGAALKDGLTGNSQRTPPPFTP